MNTINTYGYMVIKHKNNIPLHIVEIYHERYHGICVFSNSEHAQNFINTTIKELNAFAKCKYNFDFDFNTDLVKLYKNSDALFSKVQNKQIHSY